MAKRLAFRIILITALAVFGFVYLLRSCLAKFDERAAVGGGGGSSQAASQFLVFEKDGKAVIFSLVKFEKTTSYSQKGGSTRRSVVNIYYAQSNDLGTAEKTGTQKIKKGHEIKTYPVELMGAAGDKAWLFAGELMAYDPFTLTKLADAAILEEKNPGLKGKLINERKYYEFDEEKKKIRITAADGAIYELNTNTLIVAIAAEEENPNNTERKIKELDKQTKQVRDARNSAYDRLRKQNLQYQQKLISLKQYNDSANVIRKEVATLDQLEDSLDTRAKELKDNERNEEQVSRRKENARRTGSGFTGMKTNTDTLNGQWYALVTNEELAKISDRFDHQAYYNESARNKLFTAGLTFKEKDWIIGEERATTGNDIYLQGGFLLDKETGLPFHFSNCFLIVHKDRIGNEGLVQLTRTGTDGKQLWSVNTGLKEFYDWQLKGDKLIVTGTDNKKLSSGEVNLMQVISLQNGSVAGYDFFTDKTKSRKERK